jgi:hypothetical protein
MEVRSSTTVFNTWRRNVDGSNLEKFVDNCGYIVATDPGGST